MTPDQLKASILQYAMEGKLVSQDPSDQPASELLVEIQQEKAQLVKEKKIKKTKPLPAISEDEIPFEIPDSWKWVRLGDVFEITSSKRVMKSEWKTDGIPFYRAREIVSLKKGTPLKDPIFISPETYEEKKSISGVPMRGDILVTGVGTLGVTYIVSSDDEFYFKDGNIIWLKNIGEVSPRYIGFMFDTPFFKAQVQDTQGTTVGTLTIVRANNLLLPLPPLAEQKRIVDKLDRIRPLIDEYAKSYTHLAEIDGSFNDRMKKSILQYAMEGKLVPQDPCDQPASELLAEIQQEKAKLVKEKKIKKTKPLPEISEDEIPFEIPDSWEWVRLGDVTVVSSGGTPAKSKEEYWSNGNIPWITPAMMGKIKGKVYDGELGYINEVGLAKSSAQMIPANSIVYSSRAPIGHINIVPFDYTTNQGCKSVTVIQGIIDFFYYALIERTPEIQVRASGTTFKEISGSKFAETLIPLPPLAEQKRIVDKIDKMFEILN